MLVDLYTANLAFIILIVFLRDLVSFLFYYVQSQSPNIASMLYYADFFFTAVSNDWDPCIHCVPCDSDHAQIFVLVFV